MSRYNYFAGKPVKSYLISEGIQNPEKYAYCIENGHESIGGIVEWSGTRLHAFLADPRVHEVTALTFGFDGEGYSGEGELIAAKDKLPSLKALFLGDISTDDYETSWIPQSNVTPLLLAFPDLEELRICGAGLESSSSILIEPFDHAHLRSLTIETTALDRQVVHNLYQSTLPALKHLELWLGVEERGGDTTVDDFTPLLSGDLFPSLTYLGIRNCEYIDDLSALLSVSPLLDRLQVLDLSLGTLTDRGVEPLLSSPALLKLKKLDLHYHFCSEEMMARLQTLPLEVDISSRQDADIDDDEEVRFVALGE